jgi:hypothetical protein
MPGMKMIFTALNVEAGKSLQNALISLKSGLLKELIKLTNLENILLQNGPVFKPICKYSLKPVNRYLWY